MVPVFPVYCFNDLSSGVDIATVTKWYTLYCTEDTQSTLRFMKCNVNEFYPIWSFRESQYYDDIISFVFDVTFKTIEFFL